tara:strand:- start:301 stop:1194 length:894 start_codon:yes stop_codon:yes gene_type:complete
MDNEFSQMTTGQPPSRNTVFSVAFTRLLLVSCVLLFGIIVGMKVSDYFHGRYFERQERGMMAQAQPQAVPQNYNGQYAPAQGSQIPSAPVVQGGSVQPISPTGAPNVATTTILPPAGLGQPARQATPGYPPSTPQKTAVASSSATELQALKQERELVSKRFEQINSGNTNSSQPQPGVAQSAPAPPKPSLGGSSAPRYDPDEGMTPEEIRLRDSPAIAKVTWSDSSYNFVTIDAGSQNNLSEGRELAVRRGGQILGLVKISAVYEKDSEAELIGRWRRDLEVPRPVAGDDLLPYPPF